MTACFVPTLRYFGCRLLGTDATVATFARECIRNCREINTFFTRSLSRARAALSRPAPSALEIRRSSGSTALPSSGPGTKGSLCWGILAHPTSRPPRVLRCIASNAELFDVSLTAAAPRRLAGKKMKAHPRECARPRSESKASRVRLFVSYSLITGESANLSRARRRPLISTRLLSPSNAIESQRGERACLQTAVLFALTRE